MNAAPSLTDILDVFCPMHLVLGPTGHIKHCGPTLAKLHDFPLVGRRLLEVFNVKRPKAATNMEELGQLVGKKLYMQLRSPFETELKGVLVPTLTPGELVINLSFGISIIDAVRDYALTSADFAATDLTVEMLYLVEAKSAAMEASRKLNKRLQGAMIAAEEQAFTDTLTGLKNRRALDYVLDRLKKWNTEFAIMQIDLDWFKDVNDNYGHAAGDHVLQTVARVMVEETRENDTVVRTGGDEFVIVLPYTHETEVLERIGQRIIKRLTQPIPYQGEVCRISASIGVAFFESDSPGTIEEAMDNSDIALYASKRAGRACLTFYEPTLRDNPQNLEAPVGRAAQA